MSGHFKVIAVGGGPAGLATAVEGVAFGLKPEDILVLEKGDAPAEAIRKFYPDKKMTIANYKGLPTVTHGHLSVFPDLTKAQTLEYFDDLIKSHRIQIRMKSEVHKIIKENSIFRVQVGQSELTADIVTIGIGILGRPNKPDYKLPNTLKNDLLFDITSQKIENQKVLVVGGGDTSSEYCQVLEQEGNECTLVYRSPEFKRMMDSNRNALMKLAEQKKVRVELALEILEIQDQGGKPYVIFKDPERMPAQTFDKVIFAIGGTTPLNFLKTAGVDCENNWPKHSETGATNIPGLYLTGDLVAGKLGGSIISAYNSVYRTVSDFFPKLKSSS